MPTRRSSCPKTPTFLPQFVKPILSGSRLWEPDENGGIAMYLTTGRLVPDAQSSGTLQFQHFHVAPTSGSQTKWAWTFEAKTSGSLGLMTAVLHVISFSFLVDWLLWSEATLIKELERRKIKPHHHVDLSNGQLLVRFLKLKSVICKICDYLFKFIYFLDWFLWRPPN